MRVCVVERKCRPKFADELAEEKTASENFSVGFPAKEYEPIVVGFLEDWLTGISNGEKDKDMRIEKTEIDGVVIVEPVVFTDSRGCFYEAFSERDFATALAEAVRDKAGKPCNAAQEGGCGAGEGDGCHCFVQDNVSESTYGVIRGLHFQRPPHAQAKLVGVLAGKVLDVAVDLRKGSPTYGQHVAVELSAENRRRLYIPRGFAHGFAVLSEKAVFQYKCDNYYAREAEGGILWNDPDLNIGWGLKPDKVIVSEKDCNHPPFKNFNSPFEYVW